MRDELGKGKGKYTLSQKILVFVGAFCVSFMAIYTVYYYNKVGKIQNSVVMSTNDLKRTSFITDSTTDGQKSDQVKLYVNELIANKDTTGIYKNLIFSTAVVNPALQEKLSEQVSIWFGNHPPLNLGVDGSKLYYCFLFNNFKFPAAYRISSTPIIYADSQRKAALVYYPYYKSINDSNASLAKAADGSIIFKVKFPKLGQELIYFSYPKPKSSTPNWELMFRMEAELSAKNMFKPIDSNTAIIFPIVDLSLQHIEKNAIRQGAKYDEVQEQLKIKTGLMNEGAKAQTIATNVKTITLINSDIVWRKQNAKKPYMYLHIVKAEILPNFK